ncbi:ATP-grasp domain-containing protein [Aurantimonas marina]|uniref:ATP-grasp domain-containing protein n=1 Tax=Aurantimonas marina TaxID=2780508 RepID=UPI0019D1173B|nr:ATP-grasp domain-containing protein [Aurantimonas marina]
MTRPTVLVAAFSARQIAVSARRAGYDALAVDFFGDLDLKESARRGEVLRGHYPDGFDGGDLLDALERLAQGQSPVGFVYGAGFEDRPELIEMIAARWPLLGNDAATVRALKNPERFAALCAEVDVPHPEIRREAPADPSGWLSKQVGGAGGSHVRPAASEPPAPDRYFQRFVAGERWSAGIVAAGGKLALLGFTRQWAAPSAAEPYRYGGAVGPLQPPETAGRDILAQIGRLIARTPLTGLCSVDFVLAPGGPVMLEINPRAGATIDVFDTDAEPLFALHLAACQGRLPDRFAGPRQMRATGLAWVDADVTLPEHFVWPDWTRDRSAPPVAFHAGQPLCTIVAKAANPAAAQALFDSRVAAMQERLGRKAA